jgi:N6-L-threonylcarbamoyladenine synthase/protein kinase Bud32
VRCILNNSLVCLGVEGTAHTFGIGIITEEGKILSDERSVYKPPLSKGIIPSEAAQHHKQSSEKVLQDALLEANLKFDDIDILAYSAGPGIPPPLIFTANFAIQLSKKYRKPIIPVNHCCAHLEIGRLTTGAKDPIYLYLSGGNTQVISFVEGKYRIFGETCDLPIGNAIDSLAREIGLSFPYGPNFDKVALSGKWIDLPYVVKGMDVSFSGLLTQAIKKFKDGHSVEDICFSFQETTFAMITEVTERALAHTDKSEILMVGGVAASKRMQEMIKIMCEERGAKMFVVPKEYSGDNGSMIGWTGMLIYKYGKIKKIDEKINPKWRTDEVDIPWLTQK